MSAEAAFAAAVITRLKADAVVDGRLRGRVYDRAPGGALFPYASLGKAETDAFDAGDLDLLDHRLTLHVWGRRDDRDDIRDAIGAARAALHQANLALAAPYRCVLCRVVYSDMFTGPDGRTLHGVLRVRGLIEKGAQP
ncbi:MAG: DUF3168 domain-containing protein [Oceanicaulis sp.]